MNPSYVNGPRHELAKKSRLAREIIVKLMKGDHYPSLSEGVNFLRYIYCYMRYLWSIPDGPVFIVKLSMLMLDRFFERGYSFNQNPICRRPNNSSVLSKKQNIGWFL